MSLDYCKNNTLKNIGVHIYGTYPKDCPYCRDFVNHLPVRKKPNHFYRTPVKATKIIKNFEIIKKSKIGITGMDVWPDQNDLDRFNKNYYSKQKGENK